jgi:tetratricopeptide (TPR) repeat protein
MTEEIRALIRKDGHVSEDVLEQIDRALADAPTPELWVLRGDAIQLSQSNHYRLRDAELSYRRAIELSPTYAPAYFELGNFYFAVENDAVSAEPWFEKRRETR